jgi:c-di-GMP-binding flagellar brake protein YcgR
MQSIERRRAERFNLGIRLSVSVLNSTAPEQRTESLNVSAGGMYFTTKVFTPSILRRTLY